MATPAYLAALCSRLFDLRSENVILIDAALGEAEVFTPTFLYAWNWEDIP